MVRGIKIQILTAIYTCCTIAHLLAVESVFYDPSRPLEAFDVRVDQYDRTPPDPPISLRKAHPRYDIRFIHDGDCLDALIKSSYVIPVRPTGFAHAEGSLNRNRIFFDGTQCGIQSLGNRNSFALATLVKDFRQQQNIRFKYDYGNFLDGFVYLNRTDIYGLLTSHMDQLESMGIESVDGKKLSVYQYKEKDATYIIWVENSGDRLVRKISMESIDANDATLVNRHKVEISGLQYRDIHGVHFPYQGSCTHSVFSSDRNLISESKYIASRDYIDLKPDLEAMGAFQFDLPKGHVVYNDTTKVIYQWDGKGLVIDLRQTFKYKFLDPLRRYRRQYQ